MKKAGLFLIVVSAAIILYNVVIVKNHNDQQIREHPFATLFSGGQNLKQGYSFQPPYSVFEVVVGAMGIAGIVMVLVAMNKGGGS